MTNGFAKTRVQIGELAKAVGVSADTLRHYERKGVIKPARSSSGYRVYSAEIVERVKLVRRALAVGFTLDELAAIFTEREKGGAPCRQVFSLANSKLANLEDRIAEMQTLRDEMRTLVRDWSEKLGDDERNEKPAFLLETLIGADVSGAATNSKRRRANLPRKQGKKK